MNYFQKIVGNMNYKVFLWVAWNSVQRNQAPDSDYILIISDEVYEWHGKLWL